MAMTGEKLSAKLLILYWGRKCRCLRANDSQALYDLQRAELRPEVRVTIKSIGRPPLHATGDGRGLVCAARGRRPRAGAEQRHDVVLDTRDQHRRLTHPPRQAALEASLVQVALRRDFTLSLIHDTRGVIRRRGEEGRICRGHQSSDSRPPDDLLLWEPHSSVICVHVGGAHHVGRNIITPLVRRHGAAVASPFVGRPIEDIELWSHKPDRNRPVPDLPRPFGICGIARVPGQPGGNLEEAPVRHGVLIKVAVRGLVVLPLQAPAACRAVGFPPPREGVEGVLGDGHPRRRSFDGCEIILHCGECIVHPAMC
ncbi:hypothetical protein FJTKL_09258 [Diaporthe vaccinii]|uniref:Uncharacterized protein n=1 Tax=Diaporthe vaccinii TaxID=105482 RepID=A0ABR4ENN7_9PEZI